MKRIDFYWAWDIFSIQFGIALTRSRYLQSLGKTHLNIGLGICVIRIWFQREKGFLDEPEPEITQCTCVLPKFDRDGNLAFPLIKKAENDTQKKEES